MAIYHLEAKVISRGKYKLGEYLDAAKPTLTEYLALVQKIKNAIKERKALLAEKEEISFWNIPKSKELNAKIAELTEDIESEKSVLMDHLNCTDDTEISVIKKDIAAAEAGLSKLEQQEEKYASELEAALSEYAVLKEQGKAFTSAELYAQRMALRLEKNVSATQRIQHAYGEKYDLLLMLDSQRDVTELLHEIEENRAYQKDQDQKKQENKMKETHKENWQER